MNAVKSREEKASMHKLKTAVFTIGSNNYAAHARVLMKSLRLNEPDLHRFVLIVDKYAPKCRIPAAYAESIYVDALPLPEPDWFFVKYNLLEANTAIKPWMFEFLFAKGFDAVIYMDPDIKVYSEMAEAKQALMTSDLILTPHITRPYIDSANPNHLDIRRSGIYNLGFLALKRSPTSRAVIEWWKAKCKDNCRVSFEEGIFVDQSWMDFAPALFPNSHILRHQGYNVAYWNLHYRAVSIAGYPHRIPVMNDGSPLRFFHFSGSNPDKPEKLSKHQNRIRDGFLPSWLNGLLQNYYSDLRMEGYEKYKKLRCKLGLLGNSELPDWMRKALSRSSILKGIFSSAGRQRYPDDIIGQYLHMPDGSLPQLPVFLAELYRQRLDVRNQIREQDQGFADKLAAWFRNSGRIEMKMGRSFSAEGWWTNDHSGKQTGRSSLIGPKPKINIYGYFLGQLGLGESARASGRALKTLKQRFRAVNYSDGSQSPNIYCDIPLSLPFRKPDLDIIHINCDRLAGFYARHKDVLRRPSYKIGFWSWELESTPPFFEEAVQYVDEIWCPSKVNRQCFERLTDKPVRVVGHNVKRMPVKTASACKSLIANLTDFDFKARCVFLACCDFFSCPERKNPEGALRAYLKAFPKPSTETMLIIKIGNPNARLDYLEKLEALRRGREDIKFITSVLEHEGMSVLIDSCTAMISLHRNEGFGLPIAEALSFRKPVVVTAYGGNMDFCSRKNSRLVGYKLIRISRDFDAYKKGNRWADPDLAEASRHLKSIYRSWSRGFYRHRNKFDSTINRRSISMYAKALRAALQCANRQIPEPSSSNRSSIQRTLIFGAGSAGIRALRTLPDANHMIAFIDNDPSKKGQVLEGYPIISPAQLNGLRYDRIVIASIYMDEIYDQLTRMGIAYSRISRAIQ
jgi:glycosyltransferase involved in cell wall biosynthesis